MTMRRLTRTFGLALTLSAIPVFASANSKIIRNPLYELEPDICHLKADTTSGSADSPIQNFIPISPEKVSIWPDVDPNSTAASRRRPFVRVKTKHIIQSLLKRYAVPLDYEELLEGRAVSKVLSDAVAPCDPLEGTTSQTSSSGSAAAADSKKKTDHCAINEVYKAPELRFKDKGAQLRFRRALLRLFEAAETGSSRDFVVIRRATDPINVNVLVSAKETPHHGTDVKIKAQDANPQSNYTALTYRPLVDAGADDVMIRRFITDSEKTPFVILCRGRDEEHKTVPEGGRADGKPVAAKVFPQRVTAKRPPSNIKIANINGPNTKLAEATENTPRRSIIVENAATPVSEISKIGDALNALKKGSTKKGKAFDRTIKLTVVKSADEFIKSSPAGAEIGLTEDAAGDTISASGAIGIRTQFKSKDAPGKSQVALSFIPFISIEQEPTDFEFLRLINPDTGLPFRRGRPDSKKIAFANITAGMRYEYEKDGPVVTASSVQAGDANGIAIGRRVPGVRVGITGEYVTDNYSFQRGERYGLDVSLPRWFDMKGYRQRQEILYRRPLKLGQDRVQKSLGWRRAFTGWSYAWDFRGAFDYVDWDEGRTPFAFDTPAERDRIAPGVFNAPLFGFDYDITLLKSNVFGSVLKDSWLKVTADYGFRHGYNNSVDENGEVVRNRNAHRFEIGAELSHSDFSNLSFGVDFSTGENFKSLADTENVTFKIKAKY